MSLAKQFDVNEVDSSNPTSMVKTDVNHEL